MIGNCRLPDWRLAIGDWRLQIAGLAIAGRRSLDLSDRAPALRSDKVKIRQSPFDIPSIGSRQSTIRESAIANRQWAMRMGYSS
jgi:hypothetical protein